MTPDRFRRIALGLEGASESAHHGHPDFRVGGRIFATLGYPDRKWGMVNLTPDQQRTFVREHPDAFVPVKGKWGEQGSPTVQAGGRGRRDAGRGAHAGVAEHRRQEGARFGEEEAARDLEAQGTRLTYVFAQDGTTSRRIARACEPFLALRTLAKRGQRFSHRRRTHWCRDRRLSGRRSHRRHEVKTVRGREARPSARSRRRGGPGDSRRRMPRRPAAPERRPASTGRGRRSARRKTRAGWRVQ